MSMLENEKYKGDALLQKSYTVDFFTKKRAPSKGEIQMFYVEDDRMTTMLSFRSKYGNVFSLRLNVGKSTWRNMEQILIPPAGKQSICIQDNLRRLQ